MPHQWEFRLLNRLPALAEFNGKLAACLAAAHPPEEAAFAIGLILDEWLTNIIKYGHPGEDAANARDDDDTPFHLIDVKLSLDDEGFEIVVRDDGAPFDPTVAPSRPDDTHLPVEERKVGGWGLDLVRRTADLVTYRRENDRNIVTLRKRLGKPQMDGVVPADEARAQVTLESARPPTT